jgi:hypothetical protein
MERMNSENELELLRRANLQLDRFLVRFARAVVLGTDEEVEAILQVQRTLESVGGLLKQDIQRSKDEDVQSELAIYRANLIKLHRELAQLQDSAAGCQARLFARQKHLHAAQAWCTASRATR